MKKEIAYEVLVRALYQSADRPETRFIKLNRAQVLARFLNQHGFKAVLLRTDGRLQGGSSSLALPLKSGRDYVDIVLQMNEPLRSE